MHYAMCRATSHCVGIRTSPEQRYAWNQYYYPYNGTTVRTNLLAINGRAYASRTSSPVILERGRIAEETRAVY
ncbi:hypothetical protein FIBSPDRAFT_846884, partial [Athelia psychrophila]